MPTYGAPALTSAGWYSDAEALGLGTTGVPEGMAGDETDEALGVPEDPLELGSAVLAQPTRSRGPTAAVTTEVKIFTPTP